MTPAAEPGWRAAPGDPAGTVRYWDGVAWVGGPVAAPPQPPVLIAGGAEIAGPWWRILAAVLDGVIIGILAEVSLSLAGRAMSGGQELFAGYAISAAYTVVPVALHGRTFGKAIVGIRIVRADGHQPVGWLTALLRALPQGLLWVSFGSTSRAGLAFDIVSTIAFGAIALVSLVLLFADTERRAVWDRVARTRVVRA